MGLDSKLMFQPSCHLVKVKVARLDGDAVAGVFGDEGRQVTNPILLCESFFNCRSDEDILRFTKRYGPLFSQYVGLWPKGLPFSFPLKEWLEFQYNLKSLWGAGMDSLSFPVGKDHNSEPMERARSCSRGRKVVISLFSVTCHG